MIKFLDTKTAVDGSNIHLSMPIAKVDVEKRTVHGWATLDNVDRQNDIVPLEASIKAFEQFRGNLREQHDAHKAVGRVVSFDTKQYYDPETGKTYSGVFVSAYVSKGAQDTWEKVLDGTLTGFSVGGRVLDFENSVSKEDASPVRIIKDFELMELSLVDSPANQLANIISVEKVDNKITATGMSIDIEPENVFWCKSDKMALSEKSDICSCPICGTRMEAIGWVESNDINKSQEIGKIVDSFTKSMDETDELKGKHKNETHKSIVENHVECQGKFAVVDESGDLMSCYDTRKEAEDSIADLAKETMTSDNIPDRQAEQGLPGAVSELTRRKKKRTYKSASGPIVKGDFVAFMDEKLEKGRVSAVDGETVIVRLYKTSSENAFVSTDTLVNKTMSDLTKLKVAAVREIELVSKSDTDKLNELSNKHNEKYGNVNNKKVTFATLKKVFERGVHAYDASPGVNVSSPEQWAYARVNGFLQAVKSGKFKNRPYDTDLLPKGHPLSTKKSDEVEKDSLTLQKQEGGVEMAENETSHEELDTAQAVDEASVEVEFDVEETVEDVVNEALAMAKSDSVEAEVADDTSSDVFDMEKALGEVKSFVEDALTKSLETNNESLEKISSAVLELAKAVDEKVGQLQAKYEEVTKGLADLSNAATEIATRVESVEEDTAMKKSGELESSIPEQPVVKKSLWGGRFLSSAEVFN